MINRIRIFTLQITEIIIICRTHCYEEYSHAIRVPCRNFNSCPFNFSILYAERLGITFHFGQHHHTRTQVKGFHVNMSHLLLCGPFCVVLSEENFQVQSNVILLSLVQFLYLSQVPRYSCPQLREL